MPDRSSEGEEIKVVTLRGKGYVMTATGKDYTTYEGPGLTADDNYHTFEELYEHRYALFLALCKVSFKHTDPAPWCSRLHSDGTMFEGWFIAGIYKHPGSQITYHLPLRLWDEAIQWCVVQDRAPEYDGHTSVDVLTRLRAL